MNGKMIEVDIPVDIDELELSLDYDGGVVVNRSYNYLDDKPTLNGETIIGNMNESDPTVPQWAKSATPPKYTAEDVGAVPETAALGAADLEYMWDTTEI